MTHAKPGEIFITYIRQTIKNFRKQGKGHRDISKNKFKMPISPQHCLIAAAKTREWNQ